MLRHLVRPMARQGYEASESGSDLLDIGRGRFFWFWFYRQWLLLSSASGGWLASWLVGWLAGWRVGWVGWVGWLAGRLAGRLVVWLAGWLAGWLVGSLSTKHILSYKCRKHILKHDHKSIEHDTCEAV